MKKEIFGLSGLEEELANKEAEAEAEAEAEEVEETEEDPKEDALLSMERDFLNNYK